MAKKKYYVVWKGKETGVFSDWYTVKKLVYEFEGAQYKSFSDEQEAEEAFKRNYNNYKGKNTSKPTLSPVEKAKYGLPFENSLTVDAACSGNPGIMEYRGVFNGHVKEVFRKGPFEGGTNNIGEFLALVHGIALLKKKGLHHMPVYSDSKTAISWLKKKQCRTNIAFDSSNDKLLNMIQRAEKWLQKNTYSNPILKWETKAWGEIPADFGRK